MIRAVPDVLATMRLAQPEFVRGTPTPPDPGARRDELVLTEKFLLGVTRQLALECPDDASVRATLLGARLMAEELGETLGAMARGDLPEMADGLADLVYVTVWTALAHGVDLRPVWAEVQAANLAKFPKCPVCHGLGAIEDESRTNGPPLVCHGCEGKGQIVLRDASGKYLKPPGWTPPNVAAVLATAPEAAAFAAWPAGTPEGSP